MKIEPELTPEQRRARQQREWDEFEVWLKAQMARIRDNLRRRPPA